MFEVKMEKMSKEPWWIRHRTIGVFFSLIIISLVIVIWGILAFFEQTWMYFRGFDYDHIHGGYKLRITREDYR